MRRINHKIVINTLAAIVISMVVNFSYLMISYNQNISIDQLNEQANMVDAGDGVYDGIYYSNKFGDGVVVTKYRDTVYIPYTKTKRFMASDGDTIRVMASMPKQRGRSYPIMTRALKRNGENIIYESFSPMDKYIEILLQLIYFTLLSLCVIWLTTFNYISNAGWIICSIIALFVGIILYPLCPISVGRHGIITFLFKSIDPFAYISILKWSFVVATSMLYGWLYMLLTRQQSIILENERLQRENITTRYNMLMSQINPHFFFNSLNSLAMLVREGDQPRGLTYIEQLSYTFRYNIQNGEGRMTTLREEMRFAEAYIYLFKIRYEDKLFFDIDIPEPMMEWMLPAMSLQPLLDNAVKHNTITKSHPFHVVIRTDGEQLIVENEKRAKIEKEPSTGIGIDNLNKRWLLIRGEGIVIEQDERYFAVKMRLTKPNQP